MNRWLLNRLYSHFTRDLHNIYFISKVLENLFKSLIFSGLNVDGTIMVEEHYYIVFGPLKYCHFHSIPCGAIVTAANVVSPEHILAE